LLKEGNRWEEIESEKLFRGEKRNIRKFNRGQMTPGGSTLWVGRAARRSKKRFQRRQGIMEKKPCESALTHQVRRGGREMQGGVPRVV